MMIHLGYKRYCGGGSFNGGTDAKYRPGAPVMVNGKAGIIASHVSPNATVYVNDAAGNSLGRYPLGQLITPTAATQYQPGSQACIPGIISSADGTTAQVVLQGVSGESRNVSVIESALKPW